MCGSTKLFTVHMFGQDTRPKFKGVQVWYGDDGQRP